MDYLKAYPELRPVLGRVDHIDTKIVVSQADLRQFLSNLSSYQPAWITAEFGIRQIIVPFLGIKTQGIPRPVRVSTQDLNLEPGSRIMFFRTWMVKEDQYWFGEIDDTHLKAALGVVVEPLT